MQRASSVIPSTLRQYRSSFRWYEGAPELALLVGLALFAVTEPHAAGAAFKSTKAIVIMVTVGLGWIIARCATLAVVRAPWVRLAVFGAAAVAILKVVVLPAYHDHTVIERAPAETPVAPSATVDVARISSGMLHGIDHRASGTVNVYRRTDGQNAIGLENFDIQPGPAYAVYVVAGADREGNDGGTRVAKLRGNRGTQFYEIPSNVDLAPGRWTVLVWCETFDVPVANSTPLPV